MTKIEKALDPKTLQEQRETLLLDCIQYCHDAHNGDRASNYTLDLIVGGRWQYEQFYQDLAKQAKSYKMFEEHVQLLEISKLYKPWNLEEFAEDRKMFDSLVIEAEQLAFANESQDVLFNTYGDLPQGEEDED